MPRVSQEQARINRQRVVEVAASMFRERGLHGVGVADIMASAGLTHGGFYGQFGNKDALVAEAFDAAVAEDRRGDVDTILANYLSLEHVQTPGTGCPLAALANDISREAPGSPVRTRFTSAVECLASTLVHLTPKASRKRRRQNSLATLSTLVGAVVLARAVDNEALANDLLNAAHSSVTA